MKTKILKIIGLFVLPFIVEVIMNGTIQVNKGAIIRIGFIYCVYLLILVYKILSKNSLKLKKILEYLLKYRYVIAVIVLVILTLGKINFSSMDEWRNFLGETQETSKIVGKSRAIRSDEWLVQTPMMIAQATSENGYGVYNENIAQGNINLLMTSAPVSDIVAISRPLTWGFLLLGAEYGYAFYWALKIVALIMVSIELALKISNKDKLLGLVGGLMLGLAPALLWWMSTAVTEAYIYGVAVIILFSYYMENLNWELWKKLLIALGIIVCLPAFAFTLYPAYQVPFAAVMAIFMINDFVKHRKELTKKDYLIMTITILLSLGILARMVLLSWTGIKATLSTVYPGSRFDTGGSYTIQQFSSCLANIFLPYEKSVELNSSELSTYIYPFIALIILLIVNLKNIKEEKDTNKGLLISLSILFVVYIVWEFIGFPKFLAKITFLYFSPEQRTNVVLGLIGTLLSIIMIKRVNGKSNISKLQSAIIGVLVVMLSCVLIRQLSYKEIFTTFKIEILAITLFCMTYFFLIGNKKAWCYVMCGIAVVAGICINPIVSGIDVFTNTEISKEIQQIKKEDKDAIWIGRVNYSGQYLIANGVKCINGVHIYPNFNWLKVVDPEGKYEEVYNRYAHIQVILSNNTDFKLISPDLYEAYLTYQNLKDLNVKYYYTMEKLTEEQLSEFNLSKKYENDEKHQYIYEIK